MGRVDFTQVDQDKYSELQCVSCQRLLPTKEFYVSPSHNAITRVDMTGKTRGIMCKECMQSLYEHLETAYRNRNNALRQWCAALDIYYDVRLANKVKGEDLAKVTASYMALIMGDNKLTGRTFINSVTPADVGIPKANSTGEDVSFSEEDLRNKREILSAYHYDPFEREPPDMRKKLWRDLACMVDDSLKDDLVRQRAALEIVRSFARIDKWTATIEEISSDPERMVTQAKDLKTLIDAKQKETDMVTKFSKDHGFAERYATAKSRGAGTLSATMRDMEDFDYDDGRVNRYDIKTSASMQQVSDMSFASIMKQLGLNEADYVQMVKEQREIVVDLQRQLDQKTEELRLVHKAVAKQELLKELATELIRKGMTEDEITQAILAEIDFNDELISKAKRSAPHD